MLFDDLSSNRALDIRYVDVGGGGRAYDGVLLNGWHGDSNMGETVNGVGQQTENRIVQKPGVAWTKLGDTWGAHQGGRMGLELSFLN